MYVPIWVIIVIAMSVIYIVHGIAKAAEQSSSSLKILQHQLNDVWDYVQGLDIQFGNIQSTVEEIKKITDKLEHRYLS